MTELPSRLSVEVRGRNLGEFDLVETVQQVSLIALEQNVPAGLFKGTLVLQDGSREYPNVSSYKIGQPYITEMSMSLGRPMAYFYIDPPRRVGVYEGSPVDRLRRTIHFFCPP